MGTPDIFLLVCLFLCFWPIIDLQSCVSFCYTTSWFVISVLLNWSQRYVQWWCLHTKIQLSTVFPILYLLYLGFLCFAASNLFSVLLCLFICFVFKSPHVSEIITVWLVSLSIVHYIGPFMLSQMTWLHLFYGWHSIAYIIPLHLYPFIYCWALGLLADILDIVNNATVNIGCIYPF